MAQIEQLRFLKPAQARQLAKKFGTPLFVYSEDVLKEQAAQALGCQAPYGLTVRYAMKANPNPFILKVFNELGLHIDASSAYEAEWAMQVGYEPPKILLTSQQLPLNLKEIAEKGVLFNAGSLSQLEAYGQLLPGSEVSVRVNTGLGEGMNNRLKTGGPTASFGIWHEYIPKLKQLAKKYKLKIVRVHNNVGTGGNPELWHKVAVAGLKSIRALEDVRVFDIGGGFSVAYRPADKAANMKEVGAAVSEALEQFAAQDGRKLHLEIEPGRFLTANAGTLLSRIHDIADTGKNGYEFLKLDTGMTEIIRPAMYGAQHPVVVVNGNQQKQRPYLVVGHCCESSDTLTTAYKDPETVEPRLLAAAKVGDLAAVEMVGAYCASMSAVNYHLFPRVPEAIIRSNGEFALSRPRQVLADLLYSYSSLT